MIRILSPVTVSLAALVAIGFSGCEFRAEGDPVPGTERAAGDDAYRGTIKIDGSSTVFPISQAMAEEFQGMHPGVRVVVGTSGTGGGFKSFVVGETAMNDASRPISEAEAEKARANGIEYIELSVAIDGLTVVVNSKNGWVDCLTVEQLHEIWQPNSKVKTWKQVNPDWPDQEIRLYGADTDSGTFDYFTEAVNGKSGASRTDYTASADDNILVTGVAGDEYSLGYFGYAYYVQNKGKLKAVAVAQPDQPGNCVLPTDETIESGEYHPLSRPLFLYVNKAELKRPEVAAFLRYYLGDGQELVSEAGYIRLNEERLSSARQTLEEAIGGSPGAAK